MSDRDYPSEHFSLEQICGGFAFFPTSERCINMLVNFILPLCIRVGCGRRDTPKLRQMDINYALTVVLNVLDPPAKTSSSSQNNSTKSSMHHLSISEHGRCSSFSHTHKGSFRYQGNELLIQTAYLGLKIMMTCFDKPLAPEWHRVAKCIISNSTHKTCLPLWKFLDFVVTHRPSIFLMIQPFIQFRMMKVNCDTAQEYYIQQTIKDKLQGYSFTHPKCAGAVLVDLALELKQIKDDFIANGGEYRSRSATMATERSDYSQTHVQETRVKTSITEITAEIIGVTKPTLATIGKRASKATILSQGSSNNSGVPFKATVINSSFDSGSPQSSQKARRRISAHDGTRILEKFRKPTQDDMSPSDQPASLESPRLNRQPTFVVRQPLSNQNSIDEPPPAEILYENEEAVIIEGQDLNPREHRLQRQDAKSRKTFKMKRTKTKTTSMRRFVTRGRGGNDHSDTESNSTDGSPSHVSTTKHKKHGHDDDSLQLHRTGTGKHVPSGSPRQENGIARSVEVISEVNTESKKSRPRYIQRSKSHDDPHGDIHAPAGTARGRIARQGAKIVRSRSPSSSPVRGQKSPAHSPPPSPDKAARSSGPAEVPVNVTYAGIPGAGSPPQSAQSVKESKSQFRFSLRKKDRRHATRQDSSGSQEGVTHHTGRESPDLFSPPGYDRPKPVVTSPVKKPSSPLSLVKARISQFAMKDSNEAARNAPPKVKSAELIKPLPPPPVPPRTFKPPPSSTHHAEQTKHTAGPLKLDTTENQPAPTLPGTQFLGPRYKSGQPLYSPNQTSQSGPVNTPYTRITNPFLSSPDTPTEDLTDSYKVEDSKSTTQTYVSSRCSSDESLTEATSLLKDEEKSRSRSSVCIYFDGTDIPDTLV